MILPPAVILTGPENLITVNNNGELIKTIIMTIFYDHGSIGFDTRMRYNNEVIMENWRLTVAGKCIDGCY